MAVFRVLVLSMTLALSACASQDGLYEPRCIAFEGDRVSLLGNRFEWHKFTDQIEIDEQGEVIDPFPGYPKTGVFEIQSARVAFRADDGSEMADHFIVQYLDNWYLVTQDEHQQFLTSGDLSRCALRRQYDEN